MREIRANLQEAARVVARPGDVRGGELVGLAHVDEIPALVPLDPEQPERLLGRDLLHVLERFADQIRKCRGHAYSSTTSPLRPPLLRTRRTASTRMPRSAALHMS